jgi:hypothetical protein
VQSYRRISFALASVVYGCHSGHARKLRAHRQSRTPADPASSLPSSPSFATGSLPTCSPGPSGNRHCGGGTSMPIAPGRPGSGRCAPLGLATVLIGSGFGVSVAGVFDVEVRVTVRRLVAPQQRLVDSCACAECLLRVVGVVGAQPTVPRAVSGSGWIATVANWGGLSCLRVCAHTCPYRRSAENSPRTTPAYQSGGACGLPVRALNFELDNCTHGLKG